MKQLLYSLLLIIVLPVLAHAQTAASSSPAVSPPTVMNFCGINLPVETGCTPSSKYQLTCTDYQLTWMYLDFSYLKTYPEQFIKQVEKKHKKVERQPMECFILDSPVKGVRLSYPTESGGMAYELIAYGVAKGQPVMIELIMSMDPEKTSDLPEVAQQIMRLPK